jgi:hypothetical protein
VVQCCGSAVTAARCYQLQQHGTTFLGGYRSTFFALTAAPQHFFSGNRSTLFWFYSSTAARS